MPRNDLKKKAMASSTDWAHLMTHSVARREKPTAATPITTTGRTRSDGSDPAELHGHRRVSVNDGRALPQAGATSSVRPHSALGSSTHVGQAVDGKKHVAHQKRSAETAPPRHAQSQPTSPSAGRSQASASASGGAAAPRAFSPSTPKRHAPPARPEGARSSASDGSAVARTVPPAAAASPRKSRLWPSAGIPHTTERRPSVLTAHAQSVGTSSAQVGEPTFDSHSPHHSKRSHGNARGADTVRSGSAVEAAKTTPNYDPAGSPPKAIDTRPLVSPRARQHPRRASGDPDASAQSQAANPPPSASNGGASSTQEERARTALARKLSRHSREPDARHVSAGQPLQEAHAKVHATERRASFAAPLPPATRVSSPTKTPSTSGVRRSSSQEGTAHRATKPRKPKVYCGNNKLDPQLKINGGHLEIGDRGRCFQQGFGSALFQHVSDEAAFLHKFSGKYEHLVPQRLWYKNSQVPTHEGYQPATLSQCRLRGWGAGSAELARRLRAKRHSASA